MNKTLNISLAGFSFVIEEQAYLKLSDYLAALRKSLDTNEADEVMNDIEIRMVEIFKGILGKREVINDDDVEKVISQIGKPEQIEGQEEVYYSDNSSKKSKTQSKLFHKQLFRDPSRAKISGVCAGLSYYTGIEISLMRAIWLILAVIGIVTTGISTALIILIYIFLWILIPKAETASDFLKMKGQPLNFDTLKEESNKIVQFTNQSTQKVGEMYQESLPHIQKAGKGAWNVIRKILGILFAFFAFSSIMGLIAILGVFGISDFDPISKIDFYFDGENQWIIKLLITLGALFPTLLFGIISIKLLSPNTKVRNLGFLVACVFLIISGLGVVIGITMAKYEMKFQGYNEETEEFAINTTSDTLFLAIKKVNIPQNFKAYDNEIFSDKKNVYEEDYIHVDITRKNEISKPYLILKKEAKGYNIPLNLYVPVEIVNNTIYLPNYFKYEYENRFRGYSLNYELVIPKNIVVINSKNIHINGDSDGNGINEEDEKNDAKKNLSKEITKEKILINGIFIETNSDDKNTIVINGKKYPKDEAEKILDSMKIVLDDPKNIDIKLKSGKNEISIKSK